MAKSKVQKESTFREKPKVTRAGVHAKTKQSKNKKSKNYTKPYAGQGRQSFFLLTFWKKIRILNT